MGGDDVAPRGFVHVHTLKAPRLLGARQIRGGRGGKDRGASGRAPEREKLFDCSEFSVALRSPSCICLVTAPYGLAIADYINVINHLLKRLAKLSKD